MLFSYYIIPSTVNYVEHYSDFDNWTKTDRIDYNTPTVILVNDSKFTRIKKFAVVYKGMMQMQGGSASCYNPTKKTFEGKDPMDNSVMQPHMRKWESFSMEKMYPLAVWTKKDLLAKAGHDIPFGIIAPNHIPGLLLGQLDLIGMGKMNVDKLATGYRRNEPLLIQAPRN